MFCLHTFTRRLPRTLTLRNREKMENLTEIEDINAAFEKICEEEVCTSLSSFSRLKKQVLFIKQWTVE